MTGVRGGVEVSRTPPNPAERTLIVVGTVLFVLVSLATAAMFGLLGWIGWAWLAS